MFISQRLSMFWFSRAARRAFGCVPVAGFALLTASAAAAQAKPLPPVAPAQVVALAMRSLDTAATEASRDAATERLDVLRDGGISGLTSLIGGARLARARLLELKARIPNPDPGSRTARQAAMGRASFMSAVHAVLHLRLCYYDRRDQVRQLAPADLKFWETDPDRIEVCAMLKPEPWPVDTSAKATTERRGPRG